MTGDDRDNKTVLRDDDEAEADGFGDNEPESFLRLVRAFCLVARKEDQITKKKKAGDKRQEKQPQPNRLLVARVVATATAHRNSKVSQRTA
jgi:hypothetical protein